MLLLNAADISKGYKDWRQYQKCDARLISEHLSIQKELKSFHAGTRLIISLLVVDRDADTATVFLKDLKDKPQKLVYLTTG
jgi:hypothetical protein